MLREGTDEEYRQLLELYEDLDRDLCLRLARQAAEHDDPDIREVGEDFLKAMKKANQLELPVPRFPGPSRRSIRTSPPRDKGPTQ